MLTAFRQQSSQVSSGSFVSPVPSPFSYTEPDLRCAKLGEPWQHPQGADVGPRCDIVGEHFSAVSFRYNQADVSEVIPKSQHLRELLGNRD